MSGLRRLGFLGLLSLGGAIGVACLPEGADQAAVKVPEISTSPVKIIGKGGEEGLEASVSRGLALSVAAMDAGETPSTTADVALHLKEEANEAYDLIVPYAERPKVAAAGTYQPEGDVVTVEICEWIGYSGLLLANRGLEPNEDSFFYRHYGFKVKIVFNETEEWDGPNRGSVAASIATVDTTSVYGADLKMICPLVFGFARFDEGILVRSGVSAFSQARGGTFVVPHFTQGELMVRVLARRHGMPIKVRGGLKDDPIGEGINLVYATGIDDAALIYEEDLKSADFQFVGFAGWDPFTTRAAQRFRDRTVFFKPARPYIGADVQLFNRGFVEKHPHWVKGMVHGTLMGNSVINAIKDGQENEEALAILAKALTTDTDDPWTKKYVRERFDAFDFASYSVNLAFLDHRIRGGGSFRGLYEEACDAYGFPVKEEDVEGFVPSEIVAMVRDLVVEPPFDRDRMRLQSVTDFARAEHDIIDWSAIHFPVKDEAWDPGNHEDALSLVRLFLRWNPESMVVLTGALPESDRGPDGSEEGGRRRSLELAQTVKAALLKDSAVKESRIRVAGAGWRPEGEGVSVGAKSLESSSVSEEGG